MEKSKRLDLGRMLEKPLTKEVKEVSSVRLTPSDKEILLNTFGSVQKALNALLKEIKG